MYCQRTMSDRRSWSSTSAVRGLEDSGVRGRVHGGRLARIDRERVEGHALQSRGPQRPAGCAVRRPANAERSLTRVERAGRARGHRKRGHHKLPDAIVRGRPRRAAGRRLENAAIVGPRVEGARHPTHAAQPVPSGRHTWKPTRSPGHRHGLRSSGRHAVWAPASVGAVVSLLLVGVVQASSPTSAVPTSALRNNALMTFPLPARTRIFRQTTRVNAASRPRAPGASGRARSSSPEVGLLSRPFTQAVHAAPRVSLSRRTVRRTGRCVRLLQRRTWRPRFRPVVSTAVPVFSTGDPERVMVPVCRATPAFRQRARGPQDPSRGRAE